MNNTDSILWYTIVVLLSFLSVGFGAFAQNSTGEQKEAPAVSVTHGNKGFEFQTNDNKYLLQIQSRLQFRYAVPADQNPLTFDDFEEERRNIFKINRARLKVGGHAFQPWLKYY